MWQSTLWWPMSMLKDTLVGTIEVRPQLLYLKIYLGLYLNLENYHGQILLLKIKEENNLELHIVIVEIDH
jgi:hypothetical protein